MSEIDYSSYFWQNDLVRLRAMREEDWELHFLNRFDYAARRLLQCHVELPPTEDGIKDFTKNPPEGRIFFSIETLDGELVGGANLNGIDEKNGTYAIGLHIYRGHRGKGYGTATMRILMRYAFFERRLNKYDGYVLVGNTGSLQMHKKLGCLEEGRLREKIYMDGKYHDFIAFGLTRREFEEQEGKDRQQRS